MQATCKHIGVLKRTVLQIESRPFGANRVGQRPIAGYIKILSCPNAAWHTAVPAISQPPAVAAGCLAATRCLRSIRSREDTPRRSAARQTTLSSNSLT